MQINLTSLASSVKANVQPIDALLGAGEAVALAFTTRLANWFSTIPTVMLTSRAIADTFSLSPDLSVITSISLEIVGQSVVSVWFNAKAWNNGKRKSDPALDEKLPLALIAAYFATDFALVAIQVLPRALAGNTSNFVGLAFPVMGMVTLLATNCRVKLFQVEQEVAVSDAERVAQKAALAALAAQKAALEAEPMRHEPELAHDDTGNGTLALARIIMEKQPTISGSELGRQLGKSERMGRKLKAELMPVISGNGRGVEVVE